MVLFRRGSIARSMFLSQQGESVVLGMKSSNGNVLRQVAVYALTGAGEPSFFRCLVVEMSIPRNVLTFSVSGRLEC